MTPASNQISENSALEKSKALNIDLSQIEPILEYAVSVMELEIRKLRKTLSGVSELSLRCEYLARIDTLQFVKSQLSTTELAEQIGKLDKQKEQKLNVY